MAGRNRIGRQYYEEPRGFRDGPPPRLARERSISPRRFEGELSSRRTEMRRIRDDNQHLVDEIVGLRQAMSRLKEDLHSSSQAIPKLRAEKELESRELTQRNLKLEAELRSLEPLRQDALQLRSEAGTLQSLRQELTAKVQGLTKELEHQNAESQRIPAMIAERDSLRQELIRARTALDYEKNAKPDLIVRVQAVENDLVTMAQESEKLRAELEKRRAPTTELMDYLWQLLGWACKATMTVAIPTRRTAMVLDHGTPLVIHTHELGFRSSPAIST